MAFEDDLTRVSQESEPWFRKNLGTLVEHPTVSPGKTDDRAILAGVEAAKSLMEACGARVSVVPCAGTPSLLGVFSHPNPVARIVVYNHFDVQPADPAGWTQADPFKFEVEPHPERGFLYRGRGTTDDKGPALCGLKAAALVAQHRLPVEIALLWETEEEIGSPNFGEVVRKARAQLQCDGVIVSDTIWPSGEQPAVSWGLRGSLQAMIRLRTGGKDVHSGLAGGAARNPVKELARLVAIIDQAKFWQRGVEAPDEEEVRGFAQSGFDIDYFRRAHDLEKLETEVAFEILLRTWAKPTFEVHGLTGGYAGPGVKTIVPHQAELKLSFRLVPNQDPAQIGHDLVTLVGAVLPDAEVEIGGKLQPYRGVRTGKIHDAIVEGLGRTFGRAPVAVREGGSIGAVPILAEELGVNVHFLPLSLPEHGYHAPNEYFDWKQARGGIEAFGRTFAILAGA